MRKLRSLLPTAKYEASGPERTDVTFPADKTVLVSESLEKHGITLSKHPPYEETLERR
jgi:hypothetical protein